MGIDDSPLRDRVLFVEGAPRSGTTLLGSLLAVHPRIAGVISESQLFSLGVDRLFANHAGGPGRYQSYLENYVSEQQLVDLVRQLCDGVLMHMRDRVKPGADWVIEKTPAPPDGAAEVLGHKHRCYPDAWYLHVVRDREAAVRSLMRAPWNPRSGPETERWWGEAVAAIRERLGASERYRELRYEELAEDPLAAMGRVFEWIGVEADPAAMARIEAMARERISSFTEPAPEPPPPGAPRSPRSRLAAARRRLAPLGGALGAIRDRPARRAKRLLDALREGDADAIGTLCSEDVRVELRSGAGDLLESGERARQALLEIGAAVFEPRVIATEWAVAARSPTVVILVAVIYSDGTRADLSFGCLMRGGKVVRVGIVSAGDPGGRRPERWPGARRGDLAEEGALAATAPDGAER